MGRALTTAPKLWRPRTPDARDVAVLTALHSARVLVVPQLQRLYGLESAGSLHPRLHGLLGPEGTPRLLERERGPDGRFYYALGRFGYRSLPADPPPVRHKLLAHMRLSPQWLDHTLAVGWLMVTWLTGGRVATRREPAHLVGRAPGDLAVPLAARPGAGDAWPGRAGWGRAVDATRRGALDRGH